jgi:hypothetical protein
MLDNAFTGKVLKMKNTKAGSVAFAITLEKEGGNPTPTMEEMYVMGKVVRGILFKKCHPEKCQPVECQPERSRRQSVPRDVSTIVHDASTPLSMTYYKIFYEA